MNRVVADGTVICVALNYAPQMDALAQEFNGPPYGRPPETPVLYIKPANTRAGNGDPIALPAEANRVEPTPCLAAVLGETLRHADEARAAHGIAGYTLMNDFSLPGQKYFRPPVRGRCFDGSGPLLVPVVAAAEVPDPYALCIRTFVNGTQRDEVHSAKLVRRFPELIAFISGFMTLRAGDMIASAFPCAGQGAGAGDEIIIEADGIGRLGNSITEYAA
jgi:5-oxopent-3-ene-1,2,5-tricarboxylate decarboxylase / 2-hydroxyhepta-2,4-diene-1,7-dioate isomerase